MWLKILGLISSLGLVIYLGSSALGIIFFSFLMEANRHDDPRIRICLSRQTGALLVVHDLNIHVHVPFLSSPEKSSIMIYGLSTGKEGCTYNLLTENEGRSRK